MKRILFYILFLFCFSEGFGQGKTFIISSTKRMGGDSIKIPTGKISNSDTTFEKMGVIINGQEIYATTTGQKVETHYPKFDTIIYNNDEIISRFQPGKNYVFVPACCAMLDILPEKEGNLFMQEDEELGKKWDEGRFDSLRNLYYDDQIGVRFNMKSNNNEGYFAYFAENAESPNIVLLGNIKKSKKYFYPEKGWFRSNITTVGFGEITDSIRKQIPDSIWTKMPDQTYDVFIEWKNIETSISYRFFHEEKIELEYEPRTKKIKIKIIE